MVAGTIWRHPIAGLDGGWNDDNPNPKTTESARKRAIVLVHASLDPSRPVTVLLHFHGWTHRAGDPYPGWRQRRGDNAVRDVALDRIGHQLAAVGNPQIVGVLPQGGPGSQFGAVGSTTYVTDVLRRAAAAAVFGRGAGPPRVEGVILSGHSGGGDVIQRELGRAGPRGGVGPIREVILFEAVNAESQLPGWRTWVQRHLDAALRVIRDPGKSDVEKHACIASSMTLRGYFGVRPRSGYVGRYARLNDAITEWFARNRAGLGPYEAELRSHFQIIPLPGLEHEEVVRGTRAREITQHEGPLDPRGGPLADALRALPGGAACFPPSARPDRPRHTRVVRPGGAHAEIDGPPPGAPGGASRPGADPAAHRARLIAAAIAQAGSTGGTAEDRRALAQDLRDSNTSVERWFSGIVPDATFLGIHIRASSGPVPGVHREMLAALRRAEQALLGRYPGRTPAEVARIVRVRDLSGLRRPKKATGGSRISMHCFGMAVDINYDANPFLRNSSQAMIRRATTLMTGVPFDILKPPRPLRAGNHRIVEADRVLRSLELWERFASASDALRRYLNLTEEQLAEQVRRSGGRTSLASWKADWHRDRRAATRGNFEGRDAAKTGIMDLSRELVEALVSAGLTWGGAYRGGKDIMHFDLRGGSIRGRSAA